MLVFTGDGILNLDMACQRKQWYIQRDFIIKMDIYNDGLKIYLTKNIKMANRTHRTT